MSSLDEFYGMSPPWDPNNPGNEEVFHQGGQDGIDPSYDAVHHDLLAGAIGYDPADLSHPSLGTELDVEELPQWGPPFVKFVDHRISELEKKVEKALEKWSYETTTDIFIASMNTDASGNISAATNKNATLYEPPPGFTFALHRLIIRDGTHNFGSPYTNAASWWELQVNGETIDGNSMVPGQGQLPIVGTWGTRDALRVRDGQILSFFMNGGPATTGIFIVGQGSLDRTIEG